MDMKGLQQKEVTSGDTFEKKESEISEILGAEAQEGERNVTEERLRVLEKQTGKVQADLQKFEENLAILKGQAIKIESDLGKSNSKIKTVYELIVGVCIAVALAFFLVAFDYFHNNEARYEKFINKTEEIKKDFSSKEETNKINDNFNNFKNCLKNGGWDQCF